MSYNNYEIRDYRKQFNKERFAGFTITRKESNLWIGINPEALNFPEASPKGNILEKIKTVSAEKVKELRNKFDEYIRKEPKFVNSLTPFKPSDYAPPEAKEMAVAAAIAKIGPMAAVAGLFARETGKILLQNFSLRELIVENGGDIFAMIDKELVLSIFAGESPLSGKVGLVIPAGTGEIGICTSSGTVGPSLSFGKADAVSVVSRDVLLADAFATALCNKVKVPDDIEKVLEVSKSYPEIISVVIICKDKIGVQGKYKIKMLK